jgi:hypothetical protein
MSDYLIDSTLKNFKDLSPIKKFKFVEGHRSLLRDLQKLSYRITQFDKKFPFENIKSEDYEDILRAYLEFLLEARGIGLWAGEDFDSL